MRTGNRSSLHGVPLMVITDQLRWRIANRLSLHGLPLRVNNEAAWPPDRGGVASLLSYNQELTFFGIIIDTRNG
jgi:hypothetical protein